MGSVQKLYAAATGDGAASVDVPQNGHIVGVYWSVDSPLSADADSFLAELSFGSVSAFAINDTRQVISEVRMQVQLVTSGEVIPAIHVYHPLPDLPVGGGERLYLHVSSAVSAMRVACFVFYDFEEGRPAMRRR